MQEPADPEFAPEPVRAPSDDDLDRFEEDLASVAAALEALEADDLETADAMAESLSAPPGDENETGEVEPGGVEAGVGETETSAAAHDAASERNGDDPD
jgi:hypothetical protein